jgi:hypothetical protein
MPKTVQMVRFPSATASTYLGPIGQLIVDTGANCLRIQDGVTPGGFVTLMAGNNLSDITNIPLARTNLGVPSLAQVLQPANNLSDLLNAGTARTNLGLGTAAITGTTDPTKPFVMAWYNGSGISGNVTSLLISAGNVSIQDAGFPVADIARLSLNLAGLGNAATARINLGLGTAAVQNATDVGFPLIGLNGGVTAGHLLSFTNNNGTAQDSGIVLSNVLLKNDNLASLTSASTARVSLGLGTAAVVGTTDPTKPYVMAWYNGSATSGHVATLLITSGNVSIQDSGIVLGNAAVKGVTNNSSGTVASVASFTIGNLYMADSTASIADSGIVASDVMLLSGNLAGLGSPATARTNLGFVTYTTAKVNGFTGSSTHSEAHGLTIANMDTISLELWIECVVNDAGYVPGDRIRINYGGGSRNDGATVWINATNIGWSIANNGIFIALKGGGGPAGALNGANYNMYAVAKIEQ